MLGTDCSRQDAYCLAEACDLCQGDPCNWTGRSGVLSREVTPSPRHLCSRRWPVLLSEDQHARPADGESPWPLRARQKPLGAMSQRIFCHGPPGVVLRISCIHRGRYCHYHVHPFSHYIFVRSVPHCHPFPSWSRHCCLRYHEGIRVASTLPAPPIEYHSALPYAGTSPSPAAEARTSEFILLSNSCSRIGTGTLNDKPIAIPATTSVPASAP